MILCGDLLGLQWLRNPKCTAFSPVFSIPPAHQRVAAQTSTGKKSHNKLFNWFTWRRDIKSPLVVCVSVYEVVYKVL